jgi:ParB family chromosome partitioning protein
MANGRRLGRGLETLLGRIGGGVPSELEPGSTAVEQALSAGNTIDMMKIAPNPYQPRKAFDEAELEQLAQSLHAYGLLQPITVRQVGEQYQIIAGERRFRAAMRMGWNEIPAEVRYDVDDQQMAELALTENIQRKDLNAIEKATSFAHYLKTYPGTTHEELANRLHINRSTVTNLLRLLDLPQQLQDAVCQEQLTPGHVRALLPLKEHDWEQVEIAAKIQAEGWSVRETEKFVQNLLQTGEAVSPKNPVQDWNIVGQNGETRAVSKQSEQIQHLENVFRQHLGGLNVKLVQTNENGKGKLVISFANHAEFDQVYAAVCKLNRAAG